MSSKVDKINNDIVILETNNSDTNNSDSSLSVSSNSDSKSIDSLKQISSSTDSESIMVEPEPNDLIYEDKKIVSTVLYDINELSRLFRSLSILSPVEIRVIELRYINLLRSYHNRLLYIDFIHHFTRTFISLGSVTVPALLSIQSPTSNSSVSLYWLTWLISVSVTCFHNFVTLFRFDKKYYALHTTYEKLQSEGWAYLELSGRYISHTHHYSTHKNQYSHFVNTIEKIQLKQISEEYNGAVEEKHTGIITTPATTDKTGGAPLLLSSQNIAATSPIKK